MKISTVSISNFQFIFKKIGKNFLIEINFSDSFDIDQTNEQIKTSENDLSILQLKSFYIPASTVAAGLSSELEFMFQLKFYMYLRRNASL